MRKFAGLVASLLAAAAPASGQDTIKVGLITDRTGTAKFYAEPVSSGTLLGVKEINAAGGVLGKKLELLIEDDSNDPATSAAKARKLVDAGVVFIISVTATPATLQAQTVSKETKTPHMTPSNSGDTLTTALDNPYFWQTGPLASQQIATLMSFAKDRAYKRVALLTDNSELGQLNARFFKKGLEDRGVQVVAEEVIQRGATSAIPQLQKVRAANPEAIFHAGILGAEMVLFFKAYHELDLKQPVLGSYNLSIPAYLAMAPNLMEGVVFVDAYDPDKDQTRKFIELYRKEHGSVPFSLPAYGYDGIHLVADAIKRAGSLDKEKIREAMQATKGWTGVIGAKGAAVTFVDGKRAGFDPNGAVVRVIDKNTHGKVVHEGAR